MPNNSNYIKLKKGIIMAVYVNTNVSSLNGRRYLNNVQNQLTTTYQRLALACVLTLLRNDAAGLQSLTV